MLVDPIALTTQTIILHFIKALHLLTDSIVSFLHNLSLYAHFKQDIFQVIDF